MSNRKFAELHLTDRDRANRRYREIFPYFSYPAAFERIQTELFAKIDAFNMARIGNQNFFAEVGRYLKKHGHILPGTKPTKRHYPGTVPRADWIYAPSFFYTDHTHHCVLIPSLTDFKMVDGTLSAQHMVLFSDTSDSRTQEAVAGLYAEAMLHVYNNP